MKYSACPIPTYWMIQPATDGPIIRPVLNTAMFSEVAFRISSLPTRSGTIAIRAGMFSPWIVPRISARPYMCQMEISWYSVSVAAPKISTATIVWL